MDLEQSRTVRARAPGKINIFLRVGVCGADNARNLAFLNQAISVYNRVEARHAKNFSLSVEGGVDCSRVPSDERNLAVKAAKLLAKKFAYEGGAEITVRKDVPVSMGLGSAAADAAATLVACDELWGLNASQSEMRSLAAELGVDVPFSLEGGTAVGTARGDELSQALASGSFHWVLAFSSDPLARDEAYEALDAHRTVHKRVLPPVGDALAVEVAVLQAVRSGDPDVLAAALHNDLQAGVLAMRPRLAQILELGETNGALAGLLLGSGPTLGFLMPGPAAAHELEVTLRSNGISSAVVTGPVHGAKVLV